MDFFTHLAWTYILFFQNRPDFLEGLFFAVLPDILFVSAAIVYSINLFAKTRQISRQKLFPKVRTIYSIGHSFVTPGVFAIAMLAITGKIYYPVIGWFLHNALDLYTHRGSPVEPLVPLFPYEGIKIRGLIWWRNPYFLAINWAAIIGWYFLVR